MWPCRRWRRRGCCYSISARVPPRLGMERAMLGKLAATEKEAADRMELLHLHCEREEGRQSLVSSYKLEFEFYSCPDGWMRKLLAKWKVSFTWQRHFPFTDFWAFYFFHFGGSLTGDLILDRKDRSRVCCHHAAPTSTPGITNSCSIAVHLKKTQVCSKMCSSSDCKSAQRVMLSRFAISSVVCCFCLAQGYLLLFVS